MATMKRFLVRRRTGDVYVWTEQLAKRDDLEEVFAPDATTALVKEALPDPRKISLDQLESMQKADLILFADVKLGMKLPQDKTKDVLLDMVKERIFAGPAVEEQPAEVSRAFNDPGDMRGHPGDEAKIERAHEGAGADQPVRT